MKSLKRHIIENSLIPHSAGFKTDKHMNGSLSINSNPLPKDAKKICFRHLNDDKRTFSWTEWHKIDD
mgnify:CR=1 FL=1